MPEEDALEWQPLGIRDTPAVEQFSALTEGLPLWLERSIWRWAMDRAVRVPNLHYKAERMLRVQIPQTQHSFDSYWASSNDGQRLALVDFFLRDLQDAYENDRRAGHHMDDVREHLRAAVLLKRLFAEGGSAWTTMLEPFWGLTRRQNEATSALVEQASSPATDAARKISAAWSACYRHQPDYDGAYRDAVLAVEAVALPAVVPNDAVGTLGKVVSHLSNTHERWTVGGLDATQQGSGATLLAMLRTLWHNQERHARPDGTIVDVSQEEAEAAVALAVTVVQLFASGLVQRLA